MRVRGAVLAALCLGLITGGPLAAGNQKPIDARTYARGIEALRAGRRGEAARLLRQVFTDYPRSPYAPRAILKVGEMLYPVATWDQVGSAPPGSIAPAVELFTRLSEKYRSTPQAARALVKLGFLGLEPGNPAADLAGACARFSTAARVYPDSRALDDAYFGSGMCETVRDRPARAAEAFSRLLQEIPASPLAEKTLYRLGVALSHLDDPAEAMLTLQEVRNRYPGSRTAAMALARITLLHRMRLQPSRDPGAATGTTRARSGTGGSSKRAGMYELDTEYGPSGTGRAGRSDVVRGLSDIDIDPQGLAVVASSKTPGVFRLDRRGRVRERIDHPDPDYVAAAEGLSVFISGGEQIAVNTRNWSGRGLRGVDGRPPAEWGPIAVDPAGRIHLLDRRANILLVYDRNRRLIGSARPASRKEGRFVDVAPGKDGGVFVLDGRARVVVEVRQGKEVGRIDLSRLNLQSPKSLAVDALGDLYVLDGKTGWVSVADPTGRPITVIRPDKKVTSFLREASSVAVDPMGRVYLAGRKTGVVVRYQ